MYLKKKTMTSTNGYSTQINSLKTALHDAEAVVIGAGAGLSASGGLSYSGARFQQHFADFIEKYPVRDMYSATFYPYKLPEEYWAYMSRHINVNLYAAPVGKPYHSLLALIKDKNYFIITTNVDRQFQKTGFDKHRLFYTQGDYGLWQCSVPCHMKTYSNEETVMRMVNEQKDLRIPSALLPYCLECGKPMTMNLRCDHTFVQDEGWHRAAKRYEQFIRTNFYGKTLYLELGVGGNTPGIIKYPFWEMTAANTHATYACINWGEAHCPHTIDSQAICINTDIGQVLDTLLRQDE